MAVKLLSWIGTILGTLLINLVLFAIVPFIQELLKNTSHSKNEKATNYHIVMEFKQEEKEKPKPKARQVREVNAGSGNSAMKSQSFKFQPDLAVAGGSGGVGIASQDMEVMVFSEAEVDEPPREQSQTPLQFPEVARAARASGTLEVEIVIGRDGRVEAVTVLDSPHPSISREAERSIPKWTFQPGKNKGIPVRVKALKRIKFQLN
jgi:TonB family protein